MKFRRQHAISTFMPDFYCYEKKLVIEVDGGIHDLPEVKENDDEKEGMFHESGLQVILFPNEQIVTEMHYVLNEIKK